MAIAMEHTVPVAADPETVWGLLINAESWKEWWPECVTAKSLDHRTLREGSRVELLLDASGRKRTFFAEVGMVSEGKTLSMTHESWNLRCTVTWNILPGPSGARLQVHGAFAGLGAFWEHTMGRDYSFSVPFRSQLRHLRRIAEQMI